MLKTLVKLQLNKLIRGLFFNTKKGKKRSFISSLGIIFLLLILVLSFGMMFVGLSFALAKPLITLGYDWLYFALLSIVALVMGIFFSVFTTYNSLYVSKDNDLLLSMPIKPYDVLLARMFAIYIYSFFLQALVLIPAYITYLLYVETYSIVSIVAFIIFLFTLPLVSVSLSAVVGYFIALIAPKVKNKNLVTTLLSLTFLVAYYYFYFQLNTMLNKMLLALDTLKDSWKSIFNPFYQLGCAFSGNIVSILISLFGISLIFGIVYYVLNRNFVKLATASHANASTKYKASKIKVSNLKNGLLKKELAHFLKSPIYLLNCGLGSLFLLVGAIVAIFKLEMINIFLLELPVEFKDSLGVVLGMMVSAVLSLGFVSAPSISIEGKSIALTRALPVSSWDVLKAKLKLHCLINGIPALFFITVVSILLKFNIMSIVMAIFISTLFMLFVGETGLICGLLFPNFDWSNEAEVVKRGLAVTITLFSSMFIMAAVIIPYINNLYEVISINNYALVFILAFILIDVAMYIWLRKKGTEIFNTL